MNLRDIKKDITYILGAFIEDCATAVQNPKVSEKAVSGLMNEALDLYDELREKIMVNKVEGSKKAYFNALRKEILERTDALYGKLSDAITKQNGEAAEEIVAAKKPAAKKLGTAPAKKAEEPAEKKPAAKKAPAKKAEKPAEEPVEKKPAAKKAPAKKAEEPAEKPAAKKPAAKKAPAKKAEEGEEKKPAAKKPAAKKAPAKKAEPKPE
ncbi:MAG: hypothetical protein K6G39_03025 [Bacteroidales bacterium]|nr:hypothetical protein [Bacteroidales bacterium]